MEKCKIDKTEPRRLLNFDDEVSNNNKSKATKKPSEAPSDISTGAIQKKKNTYKTIKASNSFKSSDNGM